MEHLDTDPAAPSEPPPARYGDHNPGEPRFGGRFPALTAEGLLPALLELEALLASQLPAGEGRWRSLDREELTCHLVDHLDEVQLDLQATDAETGHPTAAHVAARALMILARALETR